MKFAFEDYVFPGCYIKSPEGKSNDGKMSECQDNSDHNRMSMDLIIPWCPQTL